MRIWTQPSRRPTTLGPPSRYCRFDPLESPSAWLVGTEGPRIEHSWEAATTPTPTDHTRHGVATLRGLGDGLVDCRDRPAVPGLVGRRCARSRRTGRDRLCCSRVGRGAKDPRAGDRGDVPRHGRRRGCAAALHRQQPAAHQPPAAMEYPFAHRQLHRATRGTRRPAAPTTTPPRRGDGADRSVGGDPRCRQDPTRPRLRPPLPAAVSAGLVADRRDHHDPRWATAVPGRASRPGPRQPSRHLGRGGAAGAGWPDAAGC